MPSTSIHKNIALAVILSVQLMLGMDFLVVVVSIKDIQTDLAFTAADLSWVPNAFGLAFGGLLLLGGLLGDMIGQANALLAMGFQLCSEPVEAAAQAQY